MNLQLFLKNEDGQTVSCIVSKDAELQSELEKVFDIQKGYGFCVECYETSVAIVDYFHAETRARFLILSQQETAEPVSYQLQKVEP